MRYTRTDLILDGTISCTGRLSSKSLKHKNIVLRFDKNFTNLHVLDFTF